MNKQNIIKKSSYMKLFGQFEPNLAGDGPWVDHVHTVKLYIVFQFAIAIFVKKYFNSNYDIVCL